MISDWVSIARCVCIQGCHGLTGFSFNPTHTHTQKHKYRYSNTHTHVSHHHFPPADLALFQSISPPGEAALFTSTDESSGFYEIPASRLLSLASCFA